MNIAWSPTRRRFPLSKRKIVKKTLVKALTPTLLFLFFAGTLLNIVIKVEQQAWSWVGRTIFIITVAWLVIILLIYIYQRWYFAVYFYDATENFIVIKKGVITPKKITIPWERIQDVYVDQDIFDRMLRLYDVHLASATATSGYEAHIDGLEKIAAEELNELFLKNVHARLNKS